MTVYPDVERTGSRESILAGHGECPICREPSDGLQGLCAAHMMAYLSSRPMDGTTTVARFVAEHMGAAG